MEKIKFLSAKKIQLPIDAYTIEFKVSYTRTTDSLLKDIVIENVTRISVSTWTVNIWNLNINLNEESLKKIMFPFALELLYEKISDKSLTDCEERIITTKDNIEIYPFDLNKIEKIEDYELEFSNIKTDFSSKDNKVADSIISLRDNINALLYSIYKDSLFVIGQERNILWLYRNVENEFQFISAISTLGNLVNGLNRKLLRKLSAYIEKECEEIKGTHFHLKLFVNSIDKENIKIWNTFSSLNKIRQAYPIHSDKTKAIENLYKFKIKYPITDFQLAWRTLIRAYNEALLELLDVVRTYVYTELEKN